MDLYRDAFTVLWKEPRVILYGIEEIENKIDFLAQRMRFEVQCLVEVPEYLGVNFDKQIVSRFNVTGCSRSKGGHRDEVGLRNLFKLSRLRFCINVNVQSVEIYGRFAGDVVVATLLECGSFSGLKSTQSVDDVRNIKSLLESLP